MSQFPGQAKQLRTKPEQGLGLNLALLLTNRRDSEKPHIVCCHCQPREMALKQKLHRIIVEVQRIPIMEPGLLWCVGAVIRSIAGCLSLFHSSGLHSGICSSRAISHNLLLVEASCILILYITQTARSCLEFLLLDSLGSHY